MTKYIPVEQSIMQPTPWSKYNFPSLLKTLHCEMCTIRSSFRIEYLLCHAIQAELVMPFLRNGFDHDNPKQRRENERKTFLKKY